MNPQPTIGIISPGDMGHAIGAVLGQHGLRVLTNLQDRSARTAALAAQAGIIDVADDRTLVREADILRSVLSIERLLREAGADVVDVGIIGSPPQAGRAETRLYVSGPAAERLAVLDEYGLEVRAMGPTVGQASGLKMCYASVTKGLTALASEALTAGRALGLADVLTDELRDSQGALFQWFERQIPRMPPKAYRWVGEMEEIARTFADLGLPPQMLEGAAALYRLVEQTELGTETPEERHLGQTLEEVTGIMAAALKKEADQS